MKRTLIISLLLVAAYFVIAVPFFVNRTHYKVFPNTLIQYWRYYNVSVRDECPVENAEELNDQWRVCYRSMRIISDDQTEEP